MTIDKIISRTGEGLTSHERSADLIKKLEAHFNTGPIIGEAKELLVYLSHNILIRDLILEGVGMNETAREKFYFEVTEMLEVKDKQIIQERENLKVRGVPQ